MCAQWSGACLTVAFRNRASIFNVNVGNMKRIGIPTKNLKSVALAWESTLLVYNCQNLRFFPHITRIGDCISCINACHMRYWITPYKISARLRRSMPWHGNQLFVKHNSHSHFENCIPRFHHTTHTVHHWYHGKVLYFNQGNALNAHM